MTSAVRHPSSLSVRRARLCFRVSQRFEVQALAVAVVSSNTLYRSLLAATFDRDVGVALDRVPARCPEKPSMVTEKPRFGCECLAGDLVSQPHFLFGSFKEKPPTRDNHSLRVVGQPTLYSPAFLDSVNGLCGPAAAGVGPGQAARRITTTGGNAAGLHFSEGADAMGFWKTVYTLRIWNPTLTGDTPDMAAMRKAVRELIAKPHEERRVVAEAKPEWRDEVPF